MQVVRSAERAARGARDGAAGRLGELRRRHAPARTAHRAPAAHRGAGSRRRPRRHRPPRRARVHPATTAPEGDRGGSVSRGGRGDPTSDWAPPPARPRHPSTTAAPEPSSSWWRPIDPEEFFFIEMNTRLQVEHPVTELVTGIDLVEQQLRVAAGEPLGLTQDDVRMTGHAVEARVYAESPERGFLPAIGEILLWRPSGSARVDSAVETGSVVTADYDPMIAKVIAWGEDRESALAGLDAALAETVLLGVDGNIAFLRSLIADADVRSGSMDTGLIDRLGAFVAPEPSATALAAAAAAVGARAAPRARERARIAVVAVPIRMAHRLGPGTARARVRDLDGRDRRGSRHRIRSDRCGRRDRRRRHHLGSRRRRGCSTPPAHPPRGGRAAPAPSRARRRRDEPRAARADARNGGRDPCPGWRRGSGRRPDRHDRGDEDGARHHRSSRRHRVACPFTSATR